MKEHIKILYKYLIPFLLGAIATELLFHFRFTNKYMREELILIMKEGNGYFLSFVNFDIILLILVILLYYIWIKPERKLKGIEE